MQIDTMMPCALNVQRVIELGRIEGEPVNVQGKQKRHTRRLYRSS